ncbi:oligosaccharide flippase family protein [Nostoc sp. WHI]|uniref:oligosaccharide flippase family protein n=1 Tax=Nostoc sp. WHI TaxID=2650611 RepID=UPI0018C78A14|nr:oligosaccharide flippase family protein [Nostoc sp. WHI]MBG1269809.1 oligosaccharide flippase family protein [Nostoc sp. WHI]
MGKRKLLTNSLSLLVNRLVQSITTFVLTAVIARTLGAYELGQYLLAFSYYYIFVSIASQGLKTLLTREMCRNPQETSVYLVNGTLLQLFLSFICYAAMVVLVFILPYSYETSTICYIMGLTIIPFSLSNITEAVFQAQERMNLIVISTVPVYILRLLVMVWTMYLNYGVNYLAGIFVVSEIIIFIIEWILIRRIVKPKWQINQYFVWHTFKSAGTFLAIDAVGIISSKMDILIISLLGSELMVGIYGAIMQLIQPFVMIVNSVCLAAFPSLTKAVDIGKEKLQQITENILEMLLYITLPFLVGNFFVGSNLINFIYQDINFSQIDLVIKITFLSIITYPFKQTFVYLLLANGLEKLNLLEVVITNIVAALSGVLLVLEYKLMGAAFMSLMSSLTAFSVLTFFVYSRLFSLHLLRIIRRPLLVSIGMVLVFLILQKFRLDFLLILIISTCAYALFMSFMSIHVFGGPRTMWKKILNNQ